MFVAGLVVREPGMRQGQARPAGRVRLELDGDQSLDVAALPAPCLHQTTVGHDVPIHAAGEPGPPVRPPHLDPKTPRRPPPRRPRARPWRCRAPAIDAACPARSTRRKPPRPARRLRDRASGRRSDPWLPPMACTSSSRLVRAVRGGLDRAPRAPPGGPSRSARGIRARRGHRPSAAGSIRHTRSRPRDSRVTRPARSSTPRCFEIAANERGNGRERRPTVVSPSARRSRMARAGRIGKRTEYAVQITFNHSVDHRGAQPIFNPTVEYFRDSNRRRTSRFPGMRKHQNPWGQTAKPSSV